MSDYTEGDWFFTCECGECDINGRKPLSELDGAVETTLDDLQLFVRIRNNILRMLHQIWNTNVSISRGESRMLNSSEWNHDRQNEPSDVSNAGALRILTARWRTD